MNSEQFRRPSKLLIYMLVLMHMLTGCVNTMNTKAVETGPQLSSSINNDVSKKSHTGTKLDLIIPVFSPGLSGKAGNYEQEGIWPELRKAEANRFAYQLKKSLDQTAMFGAVRVTPDSTASGDLYVLGTIIESDGIDVEFDLTVVDASGKTWLDKRIKHEVGEGFYRNPRNVDKDAYQPVFDKASAEIVQALLKQKAAQLAELKHIADLRFAASFNDKAFLPYLDTTSKPIKLVSMPSDIDPLYQRVQSVRVREQLFVDNMQPHYSGFSQKMEESYLLWQKASFTEIKLQQEASSKSFWKIVGGALLVAAAVAAAANNDSNSVGTDIATIAAGVGGAALITSGISSKKEAEFHQESINELGESVNLEMAPQVISFEEQTVELTGDIEQQFKQWRDFMARMYELEATPSLQL